MIDSQPYQRLRSIKQLGFGELSFPGGTHNRYLHSLGAMHLAGRAFDAVMAERDLLPIPTAVEQQRLRQVLRLAALLHDVGHAPLSHATESALPTQDLLPLPYPTKNTTASHEDFSLAIILTSELAGIIEREFRELQIRPEHVAALISAEVPIEEGGLMAAGLDYRPLLSQLVSGELDVDRMDYLLRDSFFTGVSYGKFDIDWLLTNLCSHIVDRQVYLALDARATYSFDDFLLSRYHMFLMVYNHHKVIVYDEMLRLYFHAPSCPLRPFPAAIDEYLSYDDYRLIHLLKQSSDPWARRIIERRPYRLILEWHRDNYPNDDFESVHESLAASGFEVIHTTSKSVLSKYFTGGKGSSNVYIKVHRMPGRIDYVPLEKYSDLFSKYAKGCDIERLYVPPEAYREARERLRSGG
ncbi:MAG: HD domain-containing protein [Myxococcales bacterium]|nr:HD domain-containing protein [Myxococcales bacterium]